jgi:multimeric flavodoxin WrbA
MKIVGILGSARKGGNTEVLLDTALEEARDRGCSTSRIVLRDKTIAPCDGCMGCAKTGECVIKDGMGEVYEGIRESDGVIWATPVYFWSMSGLTKMALDRTFALNFPTLQQAGKIGGAIFVAGSRGCVSAASPFNMYFIYNHMFAAEFAWGYAAEKGGIKKDALALDLTKTMVHQMEALFRANLSYPAEFNKPIHRLVLEGPVREQG